MRVVKTKALISFAVTAKLICAFVFAYADSWFSHAAAQLLYPRWAISYTILDSPYLLMVSSFHGSIIHTS